VVTRDMRANSVASEGFSFLAEQARLGYTRSINFADALAVRVIEESGSGRSRILDTTLAAQKSSGQ
jgi:hypothetical protein